MTLPVVLPTAASGSIDVVGVGENSVDLVAVVAEFPAPGSKQRLESLRTFPGGQVATAMVCCARLGRRACYVGAVGGDAEAAVIADALERAGVEAHLARHPGRRTRSAVILVDRRSGERTVLEHRDEALSVSGAALDITATGRVLLVDATDPDAALAAARVARGARVPVVLDIDRGSAADQRVLNLLRSVDIVIAAEALPRTITGASGTGEALRRLAEISGATVAIATLGAEGSLAWCGGVEFRTSAYQVDALDTTGAGDAFRGGFIAGWLDEGAEASLQAVLEYANAVAALNCRAFGAQTSLPTRSEALAAVVTAHRRGVSK